MTVGPRLQHCKSFDILLTREMQLIEQLQERVKTELEPVEKLVSELKKVRY